VRDWFAIVFLDSFDFEWSLVCITNDEHSITSLVDAVYGYQIVNVRFNYGSDDENDMKESLDDDEGEYVGEERTTRKGAKAQGRPT